MDQTTLCHLSNGHERENVVAYRQNTFPPQNGKSRAKMRAWKNGIERAKNNGQTTLKDGPRPFEDLTVAVASWR